MLGVSLPDRLSQRVGLTTIALAVTGVFAAPASADLVPGLGMSWDVTNDGLPQMDFQPDAGQVWATPDGSYHYRGAMRSPAWELDWDCAVRTGNAESRTGPQYVDAFIQVTNNSANTETFFLLMTVSGIAPVAPSSIIDGSVDATVTDQSANGFAQLSAPSGGSVYSAYVDLVDVNTDAPVATLMDDGYALTTNQFLGTANDGASFLPSPGPSASTSISILLKFTLSPGDSASVSGIFTIEAVPGPGVLMVFGTFGVGLGRRRRQDW